MTFAVISRWDNDGRGVKFLEFDTAQDAADRLATIVGRYPDAFVAKTPGPWDDNWHVNGLSKTLSIVSRPPTPPRVFPPAMRDVPANVNDIAGLRTALNAILAHLRGDR